MIHRGERWKGTAKKKKKKIKNNNTETCYSGSATVVFTSIPQNWTTAFIMSPVQ